VSSVKNIDTVGVPAWNTSLIKKNSGLRIELKEFVNEETPAEETESKPIKKMKKSSDKPTCDVCGAVFKENKYLFRHRYRQHGLKRKEKPSEQLTINTIKQEKVDMKARHPTCATCSKVFDTKENLEKHIRKKHVEAGTDKKYKCDECPKSFKGGAELRVHKRTHLPDSEKPYKCEQCQKAFCQGGNLRTHLQKFHGVENPVIERVNVPSDNVPNIVNESADDSILDSNGEETSDDTLQTEDEDPINLDNLDTDQEEDSVDTDNIILETEEGTEMFEDV